MKKVMLSQPMAGKTDAEIAETRERAIQVLKAKGFEVVNTLFTDEWYSTEQMEKRGVEQIPLCFLAKSLENMSLCHAAYFCKGWEKARGCIIEHDAAVAYGLEIIYEEEQAKGYTRIVITFKNGHSVTWVDGWDDYAYDGKVFIVKKDGAWVGIYNMDNVLSVVIK